MPYRAFLGIVWEISAKVLIRENDRLMDFASKVALIASSFVEAQVTHARSVSRKKGLIKVTN